MKIKGIFPTLRIPFLSILRKYIVLLYLTSAFWQTTLVVSNRNEDFMRA